MQHTRLKFAVVTSLRSENYFELLLVRHVGNQSVRVSLICWNALSGKLCPHTVQLTQLSLPLQELACSLKNTNPELPLLVLADQHDDLSSATLQKLQELGTVYFVQDFGIGSQYYKEDGRYEATPSPPCRLGLRAASSCCCHGQAS